MFGPLKYLLQNNTSSDDNLIEPLQQLPEQTYRSIGQARWGAHALALGVFEYALYDLCREHSPTCGKHPNSLCHHCQAVAWVTAEESSWIYSFQSLCDMFCLDAGKIREQFAQHLSR